MMEDRILLDQICTQSKYDLKKLYENDPEDDEIDDSPYSVIDNSCSYYEPSDINKLLSEYRNSISIFCLNCQGLKAHWDQFTQLMHETNGINGSFDIIGITELYSMEENDCHLPGYHPIQFNIRNEHASSRGGVAMYIKNNLEYKQRSDLSIFIPHIFESIFVEIRHNNKSMIVGTVYRPNTPPKADLEIFMHTMNELQNLLNSENIETVITGDININLLNFGTHTTTNQYLENIFAQGFIPLITKPTRVT